MRRSLVRLKRGAARLGVLAGIILTVAAPLTQAQAQIGSDRYASIVIDAKTGDLLSAVDADAPRYPASLTKMMTIYMLFEALRDRRVSLDQAVPVSMHAASMMPSKLGLVPGTAITVEQALLGLVTKSANDAASALGELLGGDEDRFAQMMTLRARALGMSNTTFRNASGWPDPNQLTTARDLSLLARHLVQDYPVEYRYFSTPNFVFHGRLIWNHDRMLQTYPGADGLKTGYTEASGCNLVTSAVRGDVRLIGVVLGASNGSERDAHMASLLDAGFDQLGVPVSRFDGARSRFPSLIETAAAATLPPPTLPIRRMGRAPVMGVSRAASPYDLPPPVQRGRAFHVTTHNDRLVRTLQSQPVSSRALHEPRFVAAAPKAHVRLEPPAARSAGSRARAAGGGGWGRTHS